MPLDRQSIEKRDFPIGRRGYEPEAVDAHLARLAEEVDQLKRAADQAAGQPKRTPESLAAVASQQVAAIVQAAETTANDIERSARDEADRIRRDAESTASAMRDEALDRSRSHVAKVADATTLMLQRVDAMENEFSALTESLRTGANRLQADLSLLQGSMDELYAGRNAPPARAVGEREVAVPSSPERAPRPEPARPPQPRAEAPAPPPPAAPPVAAAPPVPPAPPEPPVRAAEEEIAPQATPPGDGGSDEDVEGARLIALNMALNGTSREETDRYLADNFDLSNRHALLDEVYASVE